MRTLERKIVLDESVTWTRLDDEAVLLNVQTGTYYGLDAISTRIWTLFSEGATEQDIFDQLLAVYDVEPDRLRTDLFNLVDQLKDQGLIRFVGE